MTPQILTLASLRQLPRRHLRGYGDAKPDADQKAVQFFTRLFGTEPEMVYKYQDSYFAEVPLEVAAGKEQVNG